VIGDSRRIGRINAARSIPLGVYRENGADSRFDWIEGLADTHGLALETVIVMADLLGPEEDFDGLVCACEDAAAGYGMGGCR